MRQELRQEVGFGCPVERCGSPYLTWHHFDPPWNIEHHHRPDGMIALCLDHAHRADAGAYTAEQLIQLKLNGLQRSVAIRGRFDWMRRDLLVICGGNFYTDVRTVLQVGTTRCIWLDHDERENLSISFCMPTMSADPRAYMVDNDWVVPPGAAADVVCPPSGKQLRVAYANGDRFQVAFREVRSLPALRARHSSASGLQGAGLNFPLTTVELWETAAGSSLEFGPHSTRLGGIQIRDSFMKNVGVGIQVGDAGGLSMPGTNDQESDGDAS